MERFPDAPGFYLLCTVEGEGLEKIKEELNCSTDKFAAGRERLFGRSAAGLFTGGASNTVASLCRGAF